MKKITGIMTAVIIMANLTIGCNDASQKNMGDASQHLKEAGNDVKEAATATNDSTKAATITAWKEFKDESDSSIANIERQVTMLKERMAKAGNKEKQQLQNTLDNTGERLNALKEKLQQRNAAFENDINKLDATMASKYQTFKSEFKHDINGLGTAFNNLVRDNVK